MVGQFLSACNCNCQFVKRQSRSRGRTSLGVLTSFFEMKDRYEFLPVIASADGSWPITGLQ
jgi:hypothetical protein